MSVESLKTKIFNKFIQLFVRQGRPKKYIVSSKITGSLRPTQKKRKTLYTIRIKYNWMSKSRKTRLTSRDWATAKDNVSLP